MNALPLGFEGEGVAFGDDWRNALEFVMWPRAHSTCTKRGTSHRRSNAGLYPRETVPAERGKGLNSPLSLAFSKKAQCPIF